MKSSRTLLSILAIVSLFVIGCEEEPVSPKIEDYSSQNARVGGAIGGSTGAAVGGAAGGAFDAAGGIDGDTNTGF